MSLGPHDEKLDEVVREAMKGNPGGQYLLGRALRNGDGIAKDLAEAAKWLTKAAEAGVPHAQVDIGVCYYYGEGVPKSHIRSMHWHYQALLHGRPLGAHNIGDLYDDSDEIPRNPIEAMAWYTLAAKDTEDSLKCIDKLLLELGEIDVLTAACRAAEIYRGLVQKTPLAELIAPHRINQAPKGPSANESPTTRVTLFLTFNASLQKPISNFLLLRELTEGESPLYVNGRLLNEEAHARGEMPAVALDCVVPIDSERCVTAFTAVQHLAHAYDGMDFRPIALPAKRVSELLDGRNAVAIYINHGRRNEFSFRRQKGPLDGLV